MMTVCSDKNNDNTSGSLQILRHVKKIDTPMRDVRDLLAKILKQYHTVDKVGASLGVLDKTSSFSDHVSWCPVIAKLDRKKETLDETSKSHIADSLSYLEHVVGSFEEKVVTEIQAFRDQWMKKVLLIDALSVMLVVILAAVYIVLSGVTLNRDLLANVVQERPYFYAISTVLVLLAGFLFHCFVRKRVIKNMLGKDINSLNPGMSMALALKKNSRLRHSVFRPAPVGWNMMQRIRLRAVTLQINKLKQQMAEVLSQYTQEKKSESNVA